MSATSTPTTPSTLLDAVNTLLLAIRVSEITTLSLSGTNEDASGAKKALDDTSREFQMRGWNFNTEYGMVLDPEAVSGYVMVPNNTLKVKTARSFTGDKMVWRGDKLYNPQTRSYAIGESVTVDCVIALPFEELTAAGRSYVTALAARRFCLPKLPVGATFSYTEEMVRTMLSLVEAEDSEQEDRELAETSPHFAQMRKR